MDVSLVADRRICVRCAWIRHMCVCASVLSSSKQSQSWHMEEMKKTAPYTHAHSYISKAHTFYSKRLIVIFCTHSMCRKLSSPVTFRSHCGKELLVCCWSPLFDRDQLSPSLPHITITFTTIDYAWVYSINGWVNSMSLLTLEFCFDHFTINSKRNWFNFKWQIKVSATRQLGTNWKFNSSSQMASLNSECNSSWILFDRNSHDFFYEIRENPE